MPGPPLTVNSAYFSMIFIYIFASMGNALYDCVQDARTDVLILSLSSGKFTQRYETTKARRSPGARQVFRQRGGGLAQSVNSPSLLIQDVDIEYCFIAKFNRIPIVPETPSFRAHQRGSRQFRSCPHLRD
jgi:hypothetical protein